VIGERVEATLRAQGKTSRSRAARDSAYRRAEAGINEVAPHLFPLVARAEERVIGTRTLPGVGNLRANRYELHGIIDVLTDVELQRVPPGNVIRDAIVATCPQLPTHFEVVVDYKGTRRPTTTEDFWRQTEWQVQTYGWLRTRQPNALPVAAGVLIHINELVPSADDIDELQREIRQQATDVIPIAGSPDAYQLSVWRPGQPLPALSQEFRLQRALRVVPVTPQTQQHATTQFDAVVSDIEQCVAAEAQGGGIRAHWNPTGDAATCVACDFRHFCPRPHGNRGNPPNPIQAPRAP
jgi:hypothetical protein